MSGGSPDPAMAMRIRCCSGAPQRLHCVTGGESKRKDLYSRQEVLLHLFPFISRFRPAPGFPRFSTCFRRAWPQQKVQRFVMCCVLVSQENMCFCLNVGLLHPYAAPDSSRHGVTLAQCNIHCMLETFQQTSTGHSGLVSSLLPLAFTAWKSSS